MYRYLLLAILLSSAPAAFAQSAFSDKPGVYVGLDPLNLRTGNYPLAGNTVRSSLGYRFGNGLDLGVAVDYSTFYDSWDVDLPTPTIFRVGPLLGYTHAFNEHVGLRTNASIGATFGTGAGLDGFQSLDAVVETSVFTRIPLGRRITLLPSVGVYGEAGRLSPGAYDEVRASFADLVRSNPDRQAYIDFPERGYGDAGLQVALPVSIGLTEQVVLVLEPFLRYGFRHFDQSGRYPTPGLGVKLNF